MVHKCATCGKSYQSIEDLSTHIVLRHPGEPVPLPAGSGVPERHVCTLCGKWYELERDLELHTQKRHADAAGGGGGGGGAAPAAGGDDAVSAFDLPDVTGFNTVEAKACKLCSRFFENETKLAEHQAQEHAGGPGSDRPMSDSNDKQYGLLSVSTLLRCDLVLRNCAALLLLKRAQCSHPNRSLCRKRRTAPVAMQRQHLQQAAQTKQTRRRRRKSRASGKVSFWRCSIAERELCASKRSRRGTTEIGDILGELDSLDDL